MATALSSRLFTSLRTSSPSPTTLAARATRISTLPPSTSSGQSTLPVFTLHLCPQCQRPSFRSFTTYPQPRANSKRKLMTESSTPYRPESLDPLGQPPRNVGVPESSIAGGLETDKKAAALSWPGRRPPAPQTVESFGEKVSEKEAQQPRPVPSPQVAEQSSPISEATTHTSRPSRPSRLRARKAAMTLTPSAVSHLRELLDEPEPKLIRVGVKNKGCSGSAYHLEYVDSPARFDEQVEQDGVKVLIDSRALLKVLGSEMDWVEDKLSARFTFKNPNITEQCGCGESFSVG